MSYASLVWANLRRRPLQSLLSLASATLAFAIYGVMFGVLASFRDASIQNANFAQQLLTAAIVLSGIGMALILLLMAGATAHAVRLRLYEFGVLKALGFSHRRIIALVIAETAAPCVAGAALGLAAVPLLFAALTAGLPQLATLPAPAYAFTTLVGALLIVVLISALACLLPALRIVRLDAAAALTGSAEASVRPDETQARGQSAVKDASPTHRQPLGNARAIAGLLRQILVVTRVGFSTLPQRIRSALLIAGGVACTTFVLLWFLSMAEGARSALLESGDPARVVLKSNFDAWSLGFSRIPEGVATHAAGAPHVARAVDGSPLAEAMIQGTIGPVVRRVNGRPTGIDLLGVGPHWREMTPSFRLLSGRLPRPGSHEVMVGRLAPLALLELDGGPLKKVLEVNGKEFENVEWQVVGTFSTGDWQDGHLIGDIAALRPYVGDLSVTAVLVRLDSPQFLDAFRHAIGRQLPPTVRVERENDTYAGIWSAIPKALVYVAYLLSALLAAGATLATMQVTHSALEARRREIATLRVLGFDGRAAAASIMFEAILFAVLGAAVGAGVVWWWRRGDVWAGAGSVVEIGVDLHLMLVATCCAVTIAMIGTLPLAIKSLRRGELDGLRDLREIEDAEISTSGWSPGAELHSWWGRRMDQKLGVRTAGYAATST